MYKPLSWITLMYAINESGLVFLYYRKLITIDNTLSLMYIISVMSKVYVTLSSREEINKIEIKIKEGVMGCYSLPPFFISSFVFSESKVSQFWIRLSCYICQESSLWVVNIFFFTESERLKKWKREGRFEERFTHDPGPLDHHHQLHTSRLLYLTLRYPHFKNPRKAETHYRNGQNNYPCDDINLYCRTRTDKKTEIVTGVSRNR